jgi:hypothetical protein
MKLMNLKKLVILGVVSLTLFACNTSTKGNWTEEDKKTMREEFEKDRANIDQLLGKEKTNEWADCCIKKMESRFENPEALEKDSKGAASIGEECMKELLGL